MVLIRGNVAKSGRSRDIEILDDFQRYCLNHAKKIAGMNNTLGWPGRDFEQSINRYNYLMGKRLGINGRDADCVGHGLRAEFCENLMLKLGYVPPVLGGSKEQMPKEKVENIERRVVFNTGHNRIVVTHAYTGSVARRHTTPGRRIDIIQLPEEWIGLVFMNPMPIANMQGQYEEMTALQRDRTAIHIELYSPENGENPALTVRIKSLDDIEIEFAEMLTPEQIQQLKIATIVSLGKKGCFFILAISCNISLSPCHPDRRNFSLHPSSYRFPSVLQLFIDSAQERALGGAREVLGVRVQLETLARRATAQLMIASACLPACRLPANIQFEPHQGPQADLVFLPVVRDRHVTVVSKACQFGTPFEALVDMFHGCQTGRGPLPWAIS